MVSGGDADGLGAPDHFHTPQYLQVAAVGGQGLEAGLVDEDDEGRAAPVQDRHLGSVDLHEGVVDAEAVQGRQQVLHGVHGDAVTAQGRRVVETGQVFDRGRDLDADV